MPESRSQGPGGYGEVSGTAGTPHPAAGPQAAAGITAPFTPPDTAALGDGPAAGGAASTQGGGIAHAISGTGGMFGKLIDLLPEAAAAA